MPHFVVHPRLYFQIIFVKHTYVLIYKMLEVKGGVPTYLL